MAALAAPSPRAGHCPRSCADVPTASPGMHRRPHPHAIIGQELEAIRRESSKISSMSHSPKSVARLAWLLAQKLWVWTFPS